MKLNDLRAYQDARGLSQQGWRIFEQFDWKTRKIIGDQFIRSTDSIGANIAEGYGRYHFLDKLRFFYNARGSYFETVHWLSLLKERELISTVTYDQSIKLTQTCSKSLAGLIKTTRQQTNK